MTASVAELKDNMAQFVTQFGATMKKLAKESAERMKEFDITMKKHAEESAERMKEFDITMKKQAEESAERIKEIKGILKESAEIQKKTDRRLDRISKQYGGLNNSIGEIVEMIIIPGVKQKMNSFGHTFTIMSPRKEFYKKDGASLMEIDLLLENGDEVMAVEVKTQLSLKWVDRHLKRLELLRKNESITGVTGKTIYAAIAGVNIDNDARELAVENGMYLIEIEEDAERIEVIPPVKPRTW